MLHVNKSLDIAAMVLLATVFLLLQKATYVKFT
jgi:hypothetical protein